MKYFCIAVFLTLTFAFPCDAQQTGFPDLDACLAKADGVQFDMQECVQEEYERQEKRMGTAYKNAREDLSDKQGKCLSASQSAWVAYRDAYGDFLYGDGMEGGAIGRFNAILWMVHETARRVAELEGSID